MRRWRLFSAVLATAAGSLLLSCPVSAQREKIPKRCLAHPVATQSPRVFIDQVNFAGTSFPSGVIQEQVVASLKTLALDAGSSWLPQVTRVVREAWRNAGYFEAVATVKPEITGAVAAARHVALTIHVDRGPRYRLSRIRIRAADPGGKLVFPEQSLRKMIPLHYGEILNLGKIREGIDAIREYYTSRGYIDLLARPGFHVHGKLNEVSFYLFLDQGRQYRVGKMTVLGLDSSLKGLLKSHFAPGDIFNWNRVLDFYRSQGPVLPPGASPEDDEVYRVPKTDKVDVWLDFRACPKPGQPSPADAATLH